MGSASPSTVDDLNSAAQSSSSSCGIKEEREKTRVVLTGFGPFGSHEVNASTATVQCLSKHGMGRDDIELFTYEVPVIYEKVIEMVPDLWEKHQPHLVIHTGVSSIAKKLTLEHRAHHKGYYSCDVSGRKPVDHCCSLLWPRCHSAAAAAGSSETSQQPSSISTGLDVWAAAHSVNLINNKEDDDTAVPVVISSDAGRYLCEFIYYTSLSINAERTVFVHVPVLDKPYSVDKLACTLRLIIVALLEQLQEKEKDGKKQSL